MLSAWDSDQIRDPGQPHQPATSPLPFLAQPDQKPCRRDDLDAKWLAQREQIIVPRDHESSPHGQDAREKRIVLCIAAPALAQGGGVNPFCFQAQPSQRSGAVAGGKTRLKLGGDLSVCELEGEASKQYALFGNGAFCLFPGVTATTAAYGFRPADLPEGAEFGNPQTQRSPGSR